MRSVFSLNIPLTQVYFHRGTRLKTMYYCMVTDIARIWINRVRLPILLVVSWTGKVNIPLSAFVPENLVSRDGFGSPVPRQPAHLHTQAESGAYITEYLPSSAAASIYLFFI